MDIKTNVDMSNLTSLGVGGLAQNYICIDSTSNLVKFLEESNGEDITVIGYGCNSLVSDKGIPGLTISLRGGEIKFENNFAEVDAGVWWDELVTSTIDKGLWGLELMSEIPGSVGAAAYINITAYGQSLGERVQWIDVWDKSQKKIVRLDSDNLEWGYKTSTFQNNSNYIILRLGLSLSNKLNTELSYQKAVDVANELTLNTESLSDRRTIIIESRKRAGSIWHENDVFSERTAGSFFRNPIVNTQKAELIMSFDESGVTKEQIKNMNKVHGGDEKRVSAAHVMLAAGFKRGQTWSNVKLNDKNVLKLETLAGATAADVYKVMREIQNTCLKKLDIKLEPEVQLIGEF